MSQFKVALVGLDGLTVPDWVETTMTHRGI
jgi:hypothetical protein